MSDCPHELEFAQRLQSVEDHANRNEGRIKKLEGEHESLNKLVTSVAVMAEQMKTMNTKIGTLTDKVEEMEAKPAKRWDAVTAAIITGVIAALVGFVCGHFGL